MSPKKTDAETRLAELEATVRGLTQELVEANERIRHLEATLEDDAEPVDREESPELSPAERNGDAGSTRQMDDDGQSDDEAASDLDDIIVA